MESKNQETKTIISLSVILHYGHFCHPNLKMSSIYKVMCGCNVAYLKKFTFIITIIAWPLFTKIIKAESLEKKQIAHMKHIKIQSCHMGVIFTLNHMTWQRQQCVHNQSQIMRYHIRNLYCGVVPKFQALIFLTRKQMISIPTPVLQLIFTFIIWLHFVKNMAGFP